MKKLRPQALGLTLILLSSLLAVIAPPLTQASPEADAWSRYPIPTKGVAGGGVLTSNVTIEQTGVTAIAVAFDGTIYAATEEISGTPLDGYDLFKSTDDGYTWTRLWKIPDEDKPTGGPASDPDSKITALVLPRWEYTDILYLATQYNVYKSTDSSENFTTVGARPTYGSGNTTTNSRLITSLDVTYCNDNHLMVVGSSDKDAFAGDYGGVYLHDESKPYTGWVDLRVGGGAAGTKYDVLDVAFSPNFADDQQVVALVTDDVPGSLTTKVTTNFNGSSWNVTVGDATLGAYLGVAFASTGGDIVFPANYDSDVSGDKYVQYVGISASSNSTVYMVVGAEKPGNPMAIPMFLPSATKAVHTMAIAGEAFSATITAGLTNGNVIYCDATGVYWQTAQVPPSVTATANNTCVALGGFYTTGYAVYAGTSGINGGFARSINSGATFALTAFICDDLLSITDLAVSPIYSKDSTMYMITVGSSGNSILWRTTDGGKTWDAALTATMPITPPSGSATTVGNFDKVALSPRFTSDTTVFVCESGNAPNIWRSTDNGFHFSLLPKKTGTTGSIDSWAIVGSRDVLVGDSAGNFYKTTDGGKSWSQAVATGLANFSSMALSPDYNSDSTILASDNAGKVYLSLDDGKTWQTLTTVATGLGGRTLVAFSPYYADENTVYATDNTTDTGILRFVIGSDSEWRRIDQTNPNRIEEVTKAGKVSISELLVVGDGNSLSTLYASESDPVVARVIGTTAAEGGVARCLNPTGPLPLASKAPVFEIVNTQLAAGVTLSGLWYGKGDSHHLWSIDTAPVPDAVYTYKDTLTMPLELVSPADGASSGRESSCKASWNEAISATSYNIWYDTNPDFELSPAQLYSRGASTNIAPAGGLDSGVSYYWRVRAGEAGSSTCVPGTTITFGAPALSRFSPTWSFTTGLSRGQWSPLTTPTGVAPSPGKTNVPIRPSFQWNAADRATGYEFMLAKDSRFDKAVVSKIGAHALKTTAWACDSDLDYSTTYYWRVRAISPTSHSEWGVSLFTTESAPPTAPTAPAPQPLPPPPPSPPTALPKTPVYAWVLLGIGTVLIITLLILIRSTRRPY